MPSKDTANIIDQISHDQWVEKMRNEYARRTTTCYKCSKCNIVYTKNLSDTTYNDPKVKYVHDLETVCSISDKADQIQLTCSNGDKNNANTRCSKCAHGKRYDDVELIGDNKTKSYHTLYKCKFNKNRDEFYRAYYRCDNFSEKG